MTPGQALTSAQHHLLGPADQALHHASTDVPAFRPDTLVTDALGTMRGRRFESASAVAVLDDERRIVGIATIEAMFAADDEQRLRDVMDPTPPVVAPRTDQEHAAWQAVQRAEPYLAVVDEKRTFLGLISPQRLLGILLQEHDEDLARLGGGSSMTSSQRGRRAWSRYGSGCGTDCPG